MAKTVRRSFQAFIVLIFSCSATSAQDWSLFPLNQTSFYVYDTLYGEERVQLVTMDSAAATSYGTRFYFNAKDRAGGIGSCYTASIPQLNLADLTQPVFGALPLDSVFERNDTLFAYAPFDQTMPFYFLPHASVGQQWTVLSDNPGNSFNAITITCVEVRLDTFLGVIDSVKVFSLDGNGNSVPEEAVDTFQVILSKNHGLIRSLALDQFLYRPFNKFKAVRLIGLQNQIDTAGFAPPDINSFFHLNAGDVLVWKHIQEYDSPMAQTHITYSKDSITEAFWSPDSVIYSFQTWHKPNDSTINFLGANSKTLRRAAFQPLLMSQTDWYGFSNNTYGATWNSNSVYAWKTADYALRTTATDTVVTRSFITSYDVDTTDCSLGITWDQTRQFSVNTRAGVIKHCGFYAGGQECTYLIGSKIDGVTEGVLEFPSAVLKINITGNSIIPNPAADEIRISSPENAQMSIYNAAGQLVQKTSLTKGTNRLNISSLSPGLYYCLSVGPTLVVREKLLVQR